MSITLKAARVNADMTQPEAAENLGISVSTLRSYEQYKGSPDVKLAFKIADLYRVPLDDLIFFKE